MSKDNENIRAEHVRQLTEKLSELQTELRDLRGKENELRQKERELFERRRDLRRQRRERQRTEGDEPAESIEDAIDDLEKEIEEVEDTIDDIRDTILRLERETDELEDHLDNSDDFSQDQNQSGFHINIGGKDVGEGFQKAVSKLSEIDFDGIGENIGKAVDKAVSGIGRGVSDVIKNVKYNPENGNYFFSGIGALAAGKYGKLSFAGSGKIAGDISCESLKASGYISSEGSISCDGDIRVSGSLRCLGDIHANSIKTSGSANIDGSFTGKSINVSGSLSAGDRIKAEEIRAGGAISVEGDCEAERFLSSGKLTISGLLSADNIEIRLDSFTDSTVASIGCESITVTRPNVSGVLSDLGFKGAGGKLIADNIEGDVIRLENTSVKTVRGRDVYIGSGCDIGLVEYTGKCEISSNSKVDETKPV